MSKNFMLFMQVAWLVAGFVAYASKGDFWSCIIISSVWAVGYALKEDN